jgi:hypothetical protein
MAISPVAASNEAVTATQALRPQQQTESVQRTSKSEDNSDQAVEQQAPPPKPTVNTHGETIGTIVNVTA